MYFNNFTKNAQKAIDYSIDSAKEFGHRVVGTEHILLGLVAIEKGIAFSILKDLKINLDILSKTIIDIYGIGINDSSGDIFLSPRSKSILDMSSVFADNLKSNLIDTEHILLAISQEPSSLAMKILDRNGISDKILIDEISRVLNMNKIKSHSINQLENTYKQNKKFKVSTLEKYAINLNKYVENKNIDPLIGREKELQRIIQILSRRKKNNPVLIGDPGVGKTAIVEGLANKIIKKEVPNSLLNKTIYNIEIGGILAGAKYRGEFEDRMKKIIEEVISAEEIILFIDEIHTIVGAGSTGENSMDASNILKPVLSRGDIQVIGATTIDEYRKNIEKDVALERRLQTVLIEEPSKEEAIKILKGLKSKYELHHNVEITDKAIKAAVDLSDRYITDRYLPDKAVDVIDESASRVRINKYKKNNKIVNDEVISEVVSLWTGIPTIKIIKSECNKLLNLEEILHKRVVGQDEAVKAVSKAVRRSRSGLKDPKRPIGSFLFLGPTGVGKTELCKALAEAHFGNENQIVRIDMSEYMEKHSISRLVGSPPGYIGYDNGGQLTEKVRRNPYSVVLFDEIEKAHEDVFNILLQVLDEGRLTDSKGRTIDFKNTVIIMTSNLGATDIKSSKTIGFNCTYNESVINEQDYKIMKDKIMSQLKIRFKPEFINRIDDIIVFHKLSIKDLKEISKIMIKQLTNRVKKINIDLDIEESVVEFIAKKGIDLEYGARPIKRAIQKEIEDSLADEIIKGKIKKGDCVSIKVVDDKIIFKSKYNNI